MCYSLLGQTVALTETSAIHLFGLQGRLGLVVAVACPVSHWVCNASLHSSFLSSTCVGHQPGLLWLQFDIFFHLSSRPWSSRLRIRERRLLLAPPLHSASTWIWASDGQVVLFQWAFVMPFCLLRANKKSQTSDDWSLLPSQRQNSSALPAFFCLCSWFKHHPPAHCKPSHDSLSTSRGTVYCWVQSLLQTFVPEEAILQIIAERHFVTASQSFISLKPLLYREFLSFPSDFLNLF